MSDLSGVITKTGASNIHFSPINKSAGKKLKRKERLKKSCLLEIIPTICTSCYVRIHFPSKNLYQKL